MTRARAVLLWLAAMVGSGAGCVTASSPSAGTVIGIPEVSEHRADLRSFIQAELDRGAHRRGFFALELLKTRPYAAQQLIAADPNSASAHRDLRPVLAELFTPGEGSSRGIARIRGRSMQLALQSYQRDREQLFWEAMQLFEHRTTRLNDQTLGLPYDYAARYSYGVSSAESVGRLMSSDEALLSYFVGTSAVYGFLIRNGQLVVRTLPASPAELRDAAEALHRAASRPPAASEKDAWTVHARRGHALLLAPFERELSAGVSTLYISPDQFLGNVPFALLIAADDPRILLERMGVVYLPSASVYRQVLSRPLLNEAPRVLAIGNAIYPESLRALSFADEEAETVSEVFDGSLLLRGREATESAVMEALLTHNILHFATHGVLLGEVVPDASSLLLTADDHHDGFLSAAEVARLDLSHAYVAVLSACETSVVEDSSQLGSLTGAFLGAGVPSVIGSHWQIHDAATSLLMIDFYARFLEVGAGEALRTAQLRLRAQPRFSHPYYWGALVLFGWSK